MVTYRGFKLAPRWSRLSIVVALAASFVSIGVATHPAHAAGTQIADCTFSTMETDLEAGGDWYYATGQCPSPIVDPGPFLISAAGGATLTSEGDDVVLQGEGGPSNPFEGNGMFTVTSSLSLYGMTLEDGAQAIQVAGSGASFSLINSTITDSYSLQTGQIGSAIMNNLATVDIADSTISNNTNGAGQAAIYNNGTLIISDSTISGNNSGPGDGGAIYSTLLGTLFVTDSTFASNDASNNDGGAIASAGSATISGSTFSDNGSNGTDAGGAIENANGTMSITDSTFSGNTSCCTGRYLLLRQWFHEGHE